MPSGDVSIFHLGQRSALEIHRMFLLTNVFPSLTNACTRAHARCLPSVDVTISHLGVRSALEIHRIFLSTNAWSPRGVMSPVSFSGITIEASTSAKLLGVVLDRKLFFWEHVELAQSRGTEATLSLSRISSPTFGLPHSYVHAAAFPDHSCPGYAVRPTGVV